MVTQWTDKQTENITFPLYFAFQINHVFDHLEVTRHHTGPVLFIEEDHYLVQDFIYMLNKMFKYAQE